MLISLQIVGVSDKRKSMIKDDKLPVKIFRFTATISDDVSKRNTEGRHSTLHYTFIEFDSSCTYLILLYRDNCFVFRTYNQNARQDKQRYRRS